MLKTKSTDRLFVRLKPGEKVQLESLAEAQGMTLSQYVRSTLLYSLQNKPGRPRKESNGQ